MRLPGYVVGMEVIFARADDRLSIRYDAGPGPEPYMEGMIESIRRAPSICGLARGFDHPALRDLLTRR